MRFTITLRTMCYAIELAPPPTLCAIWSRPSVAAVPSVDQTSGTKWVVTSASL